MALLLALAANIGVGTMVEGFRKTFTSWLDRRLVAEIYFDARSNEQGARIARWLEARSDVDAILPVWKAETRIAGWPTDVYGSRDHTTYRQNWALIAAMPDAWDRVHAGGAALISEQTARRLGISLGATLQIPTANGEWPVEVAGIYADYGNPKGQVRVDVAALLSHWPAVRRTSYALRVPPDKVAGLIEAMGAAFGGDMSRIVDQAGLKTMSKSIFERTFAVTAALNTLTLGVAGIALFASLLTLSNLRLAQLAPVWAVGVTRRRLAQIELGKIILLAAFTAVAALPVGLAVAWCLVAVVNVEAFGWRLPLHVFPVQWAQLLGLALLTAALASLPPIIRLGRTTPAHLIKVFVNER
jgi:putative ABC transport system permease protein